MNKLRLVGSTLLWSQTHSRCRSLKRFYSLSSASVSEDPTKLEVEDLQLKRAEFRTLVDIFSEYGSSQTHANQFRLRDSLTRPPAETTISALLAAGAHFGHESSRMMPNFMPYAYGIRSGITIIDLNQTLPLLRRAAQLVRSVAYAGGQILFIGTRPDLRSVVRKAAERLGPQGYYVSDRWLPGTLTNKIQMFGNDDLRKVNIIPDLVILLNPLANLNAIRECAVDHVPTIGIVDSNADPRIVMYPIPANDESTRTAEVVAGVLSIAGRQGISMRFDEEPPSEDGEVEGPWDTTSGGDWTELRLSEEPSMDGTVSLDHLSEEQIQIITDFANSPEKWPPQLEKAASSIVLEEMYDEAITSDDLEADSEESSRR